MLAPEEVLQSLQEQIPVGLTELPDDHGVYALVDHVGSIRYIGVTESPTMGFRRRIFQYHVTGSEGRSHKFSQAYNTGRMWRSRSPDARQLAHNAKVAKSLRTRFCREYCKATYFPVTAGQLTDGFFQFLTRLEGQVQQLAPPSMRSWEGIKFRSVVEPVELVDRLIALLGLSQSELRALEAQAQLCDAEARRGDGEQSLARAEGK